MITYKILKSLLDYNPDTGEFVWLVYRGRQAKEGDKAGDNKIHGEFARRN